VLVGRASTPVAGLQTRAARTGQEARPAPKKKQEKYDALMLLPYGTVEGRRGRRPRLAAMEEAA